MVVLALTLTRRQTSYDFRCAFWLRLCIPRATLPITWTDDKRESSRCTRTLYVRTIDLSAVAGDASAQAQLEAPKGRYGVS